MKMKKTKTRMEAARKVNGYFGRESLVDRIYQCEPKTTDSVVKRIVQMVFGGVISSTKKLSVWKFRAKGRGVDVPDLRVKKP